MERAVRPWPKGMRLRANGSSRSRGCCMAARMLHGLQRAASSCIHCYTRSGGSSPPAHRARGSRGRRTRNRRRPACKCERASAPPARRTGEREARAAARPATQGQHSNGYATHLASPLQGHNVREEQRVEALVAGHGAVERRGRGEEGNGLRLLLPGGTPEPAQRSARQCLRLHARSERSSAAAPHPHLHAGAASRWSGHQVGRIRRRERSKGEHYG